MTELPINLYERSTQEETINQEQQIIDDDNNNATIGNGGGYKTAEAQSFKLSANFKVTAVELMLKLLNYTPPDPPPDGNWHIRIETDNDVGWTNYPSGTLADVNATVDIIPPSVEGISAKGTFTTPFTLTGNITYWLVIKVDEQDTVEPHYGRGWILGSAASNHYVDGRWKQSVDNGTTWTFNESGLALFDLYFKVYVLVNVGSELPINFYEREATPILLYERS